MFYIKKTKENTKKRQKRTLKNKYTENLLITD